mmetsp:Transcript_14123/g.40137  ORF Transcript_14123/g.40137 Transcript_14123/m.40137 type:complete len:176 (+) Transcript_14123:143-670(+)|eukprot:CAMPEP_0119144834 /NCGR_PEP_ID=MMETSP1310-20130426/36579_1 /TAXON_ID=464262 /ORGANISM="Genus nov. species nov., Strain RCC2339" /LENGTH=175 /DNA_ID=CAMNT_0007136613 /DNA_START=76 /DNA_END=603 /DNA_ORIENTATION=+
MESDLTEALVTLQQRAEGLRETLAKLQGVGDAAVLVRDWPDILTQYNVLVKQVDFLLEQCKPRMRHHVIYPQHCPPNEDPNRIPELLRTKLIPELARPAGTDDLDGLGDFPSESDIRRNNRTLQRALAAYATECQTVRASLECMDTSSDSMLKSSTVSPADMMASITLGVGVRPA